MFDPSSDEAGESSREVTAEEVAQCVNVLRRIHPDHLIPHAASHAHASPALDYRELLTAGKALFKSSVLRDEFNSEDVVGYMRERHDHKRMLTKLNKLQSQIAASHAADVARAKECQARLTPHFPHMSHPIFPIYTTGCIFLRKARLTSHAFPRWHILFPLHTSSTSNSLQINQDRFERLAAIESGGVPLLTGVKQLQIGVSAESISGGGGGGGGGGDGGGGGGGGGGDGDGVGGGDDGALVRAGCGGGGRLSGGGGVVLSYGALPVKANIRYEHLKEGRDESGRPVSPPLPFFPTCNTPFSPILARFGVSISQAGLVRGAERALATKARPRCKGHAERTASGRSQGAQRMPRDGWTGDAVRDGVSRPSVPRWRHERALRFRIEPSGCESSYRSSYRV